MIKHWKIYLLISIMCFIPMFFLLYLISKPMSGAESDSWAWFFILIPGGPFSVVILAIIGLIMLTPAIAKGMSAITGK